MVVAWASAHLAVAWQWRQRCQLGWQEPQRGWWLAEQPSLCGCPACRQQNHPAVTVQRPWWPALLRHAWGCREWASREGTAPDAAAGLLQDPAQQPCILRTAVRSSSHSTAHHNVVLLCPLQVALQFERCLQGSVKEAPTLVGVKLKRVSSDALCTYIRSAAAP